MRWNAHRTLSSFQEAFGRGLTAPFVFSTGEFQYNYDQYPVSIVSDINKTSRKSSLEGMSVYNQQYWFRLLTNMQESFPLLDKFLGTWTLNQLVTNYLNDYPSRNTTLDNLGSDLHLYIRLGKWIEYLYPKQEIPDKHLRLLAQAAKLDLIFSGFLFQEDIVEVESGPLFEPELKPAVMLFREDWALLETRNNIKAFSGKYQDISEGTSRWVLYKFQGMVHFEKVSVSAFVLLKYIRAGGSLNNGLELAQCNLNIDVISEIEANAQQWFHHWGQKGWFNLPNK